MAKSQSPSVVSAAGNKVTRKEDWEEKIHVTRKRNLKREQCSILLSLSGFILFFLRVAVCFFFVFFATCQNVFFFFTNGRNLEQLIQPRKYTNNNKQANIATTSNNLSQTHPEVIGQQLKTLEAKLSLHFHGGEKCLLVLFPILEPNGTE